MNELFDIPESATSTWDLLPDLGFIEDTSFGGRSISFGKFKLSACRGLNRWCAPVILLTGVLASTRSISSIESEIPIAVESPEQGIAWITWCLDNAADGHFNPANAPAWFAVGRLHRHLLPWERERAAYATRPHCYVDRDWARVARTKMSESFMGVDEAELIHFSFDGTILTIRGRDAVIVVPATGQAWGESYMVRAGLLRQLPARFMHQLVEVSVWEAHLRIANRIYPIA